MDKNTYFFIRTACQCPYIVHTHSKVLFEKVFTKSILMCSVICNVYKKSINSVIKMFVPELALL